MILHDRLYLIVKSSITFDEKWKWCKSIWKKNKQKITQLIIYIRKEWNLNVIHQQKSIRCHNQIKSLQAKRVGDCQKWRTRFVDAVTKLIQFWSRIKKKREKHFNWIRILFDKCFVWFHRINWDKNTIKKGADENL